jgi:hypothetical protein
MGKKTVKFTEKIWGRNQPTYYNHTPVSFAQIDPENYPEQKWPKMIDPAKTLSPAESGLNLIFFLNPVYFISDETNPGSIF